MIDRDPSRYLGGKLVVYGGIPFALCLGLSSPDISDNSLGDVVYKTGRHSAPIFSGDTVFASTEIRAVHDLPGRPDLGRLEVSCAGTPGAPAATKRSRFPPERELAVKRRSTTARPKSPVSLPPAAPRKWR
jgi:acyl dehydratase